jgi:hypothetical protein
MTAARSWTLMAVAGSLLTWLALLPTTGYGRAFLFDVVYCKWGIGPQTQSRVGLILGVLAFATELTFVTDVMQRPGLSRTARLLWAVALLVVGVVAMPVYWWTYLREPRSL